MILHPSEVRAARLARGVSQTQLAAASGVHIVMISRIENGRTDSTSGTLRALTEALGIVVEVPDVPNLSLEQQ